MVKYGEGVMSKVVAGLGTRAITISGRRSQDKGGAGKEDTTLDRSWDIS